MGTNHQITKRRFKISVAVLLTIVTLSSSLSVCGIPGVAAAAFSPALDLPVKSAKALASSAAPAYWSWSNWFGKTAGETVAVKAPIALSSLQKAAEIADKWSNLKGAALVGTVVAGVVAAGYLAKCSYRALVSPAENTFTDEVETANNGDYLIAQNSVLAGGAAAAVTLAAEPLIAATTHVQNKWNQLVSPTVGKGIGYALGAVATAAALMYAGEKTKLWWDTWKFHNLLIADGEINPGCPRNKFRWSGSYCISKGSVNELNNPAVLDAAFRTPGTTIAVGARTIGAMLIAAGNGTAYVFDAVNGRVITAAELVSYRDAAQHRLIRDAIAAEKAELSKFLNHSGNAHLKAELFGHINRDLAAAVRPPAAVPARGGPAVAIAPRIQTINDLATCWASDMIRSRTQQVRAAHTIRQAKENITDRLTNIWTDEYRDYVYLEAAKAYARACVLYDIVDSYVTGVAGRAVPVPAPGAADPAAALDRIAQQRIRIAEELGGLAAAMGGHPTASQSARQLELTTELAELNAENARLLAARVRAEGGAEGADGR